MTAAPRRRVDQLRIQQLRDDVEAHLRAAGVRPLLVAPAGIGSSSLEVILQSTRGDQERALEVVRQVEGVREAEFRRDTQAPSIMSVELRY
ncbi:hypothetical protein [Kineosporia succinea]|uniref:Translation elongation factor EF-1beta n=1 Tax=Kineosporia succinea TaxID=84632 RepID=A0ABT9P5Q9_9ACTN|nr:hypothetical protein [Kineosporia succinea]MDP9828028.1 translation elongation factor EF-1beta [Kineosporia succinea]